MKYIPVTGQKKYCDMMRELSGANDKDKQVVTAAGVAYLSFSGQYTAEQHLKHSGFVFKCFAF